MLRILTAMILASLVIVPAAMGASVGTPEATSPEAVCRALFDALIQESEDLKLPGTVLPDGKIRPDAP